MIFFKIISILVLVYMLIGYYFAVKHISSLKDMIDNAVSKKAFYEEMVRMHGTSPSGAEYYVALQELIIENKELLIEAEEVKEKGWIWYAELIIPFLVAWPHLNWIENKISRD